MTLKSYQQEIQVNTLYKITHTGTGDEQISPNIWVNDGVVDVLVANGDAPTAAPAGMQIIENGEGITGVAAFAIIPTYLYVSQSSGTSTEVVLSGIAAEAV